MSIPESFKKAIALRKSGKLTPMKAIRLLCVDCSGYVVADVRDCVIPDCPLYDYRLGRNPKRKGLGTKNPTQLAVSGKESND